MTDHSVEDYLAHLQPDRRRQEAIALNTLFCRVTGFAPRLWGGSMIGYGQYHYVYASGREGDALATGFAARKAALSIYIMPGYADFSDILGRLGKHKMGKSCLYINKLGDVDLEVLAELIVAGLRNLETHWPVQRT